MREGRGGEAIHKKGKKGKPCRGCACVTASNPSRSRRSRRRRGKREERVGECGEQGCAGAHGGVQDAVGVDEEGVVLAQLQTCPAIKSKIKTKVKTKSTHGEVKRSKQKHDCI